MNKQATFFLLILALLLQTTPSFSQNVKVTKENKAEVMKYILQGGDTLFVDEIEPARIYAKGPKNSRDWILYYKRVYNFAKAYPYSLVVAQVIHETDSLFAAQGFTKAQQNRYLERMKDSLLENFKPLFKQLTLSQGLMMIRLIDRAVGKTPYVIIDEYLGGANAVFWQGFAKLCKGNLKVGYDRYGEDEDLEELVGYWRFGTFDVLYEMIFGEPVPQIVIPPAFQEPFYKTLENDRYFKKILGNPLIK